MICDKHSHIWMNNQCIVKFPVRLTEKPVNHITRQRHMFPMEGLEVGSKQCMSIDHPVFKRVGSLHDLSRFTSLLVMLCTPFSPILPHWSCDARHRETSCSTALR